MDIRKYFHLSLTVFHVVRTIFKVFQDQRQLVNEADIKITSNSTSALYANLHLSLWAPPAWWKCNCGSTLLFKWWFSWTWPLSCSEKRIIFDDFQHIPASLAWYLCCHPSRRQQPQKLTLMLKWCSSWTGQCKKNGNFDSKTYKSTHVFCVCVSPLLKAPLLLADWLPARNLRVSFSFS